MLKIKTTIQFCVDFVKYGDGQTAIAIPAHVLYVWCHAPAKSKPAIVPAGEMKSGLKKVEAEIGYSIESLQE